jgi:hypothetical protein
VAHLLAVRVHDPGHHLLVGAHVGSRNVLVGPDEVDDLGGVAAGDPLDLGARQLGGVDPHPSLGASERDADDGALPGHQHRQRRHLSEVHIGRIPDAALGGTHGQDVLHPVAEQGLDPGAVIAAVGDGDDDRPLRHPQSLRDVGVEIHQLRHSVELTECLGVKRRLPLPQALAEHVGTLELL